MLFTDLWRLNKTLCSAPDTPRIIFGALEDNSKVRLEDKQDASPLVEVLHKPRINITMETSFSVNRLKKLNLRNLNEDLNYGKGCIVKEEKTGIIQQKALRN